MTNPLIVFALEQESQNLFSEYNVIYTGVGKVSAAYALTRSLYQNRPDVVINLGTAGSAVHKTGSIVHCTIFVQRDMDVSPLGFPKWKTPFSDDPIFLEHGLALPNTQQAICGTGDSFDINHKGEEYGVVDMEAYALAKICLQEKIPFLCVKYISDGADGQASHDWNESLRHAAIKLKESIRDYLDNY